MKSAVSSKNVNSSKRRSHYILTFEEASADLPGGDYSRDADCGSDSFFKVPPLLDGLSVDKRRPPEPEKISTVDLPVLIPPVDDPWLLESDRPFDVPQYKSWEGFTAGHTNSAAPVFGTELSPEALDALVSSETTSFGFEAHDKYPVLSHATSNACLLALSLGRESVLFAWDEEKKSFISTLGPFRVPGCSGVVLQGIKKLCLDCGNTSRLLKAFVDRAYAVHTSPSKIAFANAVRTLLVTIQSELGLHGRTVKSLIQLQGVIERVRSVLQYCRGLVLKLSRSTTDEQLLSLLFEEVQSIESGGLVLRDISREFLKAASKPWTDFVEEWIGLAPEKGIPLDKIGSGKGFVKVDNRLWVDDMGVSLEEPDYCLDETKMPAFIPDEVGQLLFEAGRNLRFLWTNHPRHSLSDSKFVTAVGPPSLQWRFDWESVAGMERKAQAYERALTKALEDVTITNTRTHSGHGRHDIVLPSSELQFFGKDEEEIEKRVLASISELNQPLASSIGETVGDEFRTAVRRELSQTPRAEPSTLRDFTPPWSLLPLLSFGPIVSAQARIINHECMRLLFGAHRLRKHIAILRSFQLLGDGGFSSRLSHALFDPDLDAAERKAGVALTGGIMGLRLDGRESWPPASSELRLALMGVLSESFQSFHAWEGQARSAQNELPGDLSFAVRDLSPEEMESCVDPDSLEALDFLRLSYKPPAPLTSVITPTILVKYDRIFRQLLRVLRMGYVANQLFREGTVDDDAASSRFRIEARHFISSITIYFIETGISLPWRKFDDWLDRVEADLKTSLQIDTHYSPDRLREYHERIVDDIMETLLLRKRQQPVLALLEDIFRLVLEFAKRSRARSRTPGEHGDLPRAVELYTKFRQKVEVLITVCRAMSEKSAGNRNDAGHDATVRQQGLQEPTILRLLLLLDMTEYYAKRPAPL